MPSCHSTNDTAHQLISQNSVLEGAIVLAGEQTGGKGQRGNTWESEPNKNITCSIVLCPLFLPIPHVFDLNIAISLAVCAALEPYIRADRIKIKWPNDIYVDDSKICGILIENIIRKNLIHHSIAGIGLNVNQASFKGSRAISLYNITGREFLLSSVLNGVLEQLENFYLKLKSGQKSELIHGYSNLLYWKDEERIFLWKNGKSKGIIKGIDQYGRLEIEIDSSIHHFDVKEVQYLPEER